MLGIPEGKGDKQMTPTAKPASDANVHADSGKHTEAPKASGPIVDKWTFDWPGGGGYKGSVSLTINSDGSWSLSGQAPQKLYETIFNAGPSHTIGSGDTHYYRWDIALGIKSTDGSVIFFGHSTKLRGDLPQNSSWNKQGNNNTIKENFASFAKGHDWHAHSYLTPEDSQGSSGGGGSSAGQDIGNVVNTIAPFIPFIIGLFA
jgi:hypothetical protein